MRRIWIFMPALTAASLAACETTTSPSSQGLKQAPTSQGTPPSLQRGAVIARATCAECHGASYVGGTSIGGYSTPSLRHIVQYTELQFDALICTGTARDGGGIHEMNASTLSALSADDRSAVREYLTTLLTGAGSTQSGNGNQPGQRT